MPLSSLAARAAAGAVLLLASGCAFARPRAPEPPPRQLVLVASSRNVRDSIRVPLPREGARPSLPRGILPYAGGSGMHVEATSAADTGAALVLLREQPWSAGPVVAVSTLPAGRPTGEPASDAPAAGAGAYSCTSLTAFFLPGLGRAPTGPLIAHFASGARTVRLRVDPRRHTLRIAPFLRIRTDTLFTPAADTLRSLAAGFTSTPGGRMLAVSRDTAGRLLGIRTFAAGERLTIGRGLRALEWTFYLLDDRPRHHSPCRGARPPAPPPPAPVDWTGRYIAADIDSTLAAYGLPPLRSARLRRGEREIRLTAGGGMMYESEFVVRIVQRRGEVRGEVYEWWRRWPGKPYGGGPFAREKRAPELDGCLDPRISEDRWVCRIDRMVPVDWRAVLARLDSLQLDRLPPQASRRSATDQGHVLIETAGRGRYNGVYYYGARAGTDSADARAAAAARVLGAVLAGRMPAPPDALLKVRQVAPGGLSIPSGAVLVVRDEGTWRDLWRRFPSRARRAAGDGPPPRIDFSRDALLVVGTGGSKEGCAWPANFLRRVEVRGDTVLAVLGDRASKQWPPPCDPDPAPVQVVAFRASPGRPVVLVYTTGRYWQPQQPPRPAER